MFRELIYYSSVFTLSGFLGYQILNYLNPSLTGSILYNSVKTYHYCRRELDKALDKYNYDTIKDVKKEVELKPVNTYVGYKVVDDTTHTCTDVKNNYLNTENFDLMIVIHDDNENKYYKILSEKNDLENCSFRSGKPIFLQVEIEQYGKRISIHEHLKNFYLEHNTILDKVFLEWYLKQFYSVNLSNDYKIHIIDDNINVFSIDKDRGIEFYFNDKDELKYLIKLI